MNNNKTFFKVTCDNESIIMVNGFSLHYEVGRTTNPKIGKIFCFDSLNNALNFAKNMALDSFMHFTFNIFEGTAINPQRIKKVPFWPSEITVHYFWENKKNKKRITGTTFKAPKGTLVVDSFTPTKKYTLDKNAKLSTECACV